MLIEEPAAATTWAMDNLYAYLTDRIAHTTSFVLSGMRNSSMVLP